MHKSFLLLLSFVPLFAAAQHYTIAPARTITVTAPLNEITIHDIFMDNTTTQKISLSHKLISKDIPSDWDYSLCDYKTCYPNIPLQGTMDSFVSPDRGFLGFNVAPPTAGTAKLVMYVYETAFPNSGDTLTWIVNAGSSGIPKSAGMKMRIHTYPNPVANMLTVPAGQSIRLLKLIDITGKLIHEIVVTGKDQDLIIDMRELPSSVYFIKATNSDGTVASQRIVKN